jgi:hypothetical protein
MTRLQPDVIAARLSTTMAAASPNQRVSELEDVPAISSNIQIVQTSSSNSNNLVTQYYCYWAASPSWLSLLFGSLEYHRRNGHRRGRNRELYRALYKSPGLFSVKVWDFAGHMSLSDWTINIRTYRIVPHNAPIFEAVSAGDILFVQSLLASKEAFVTDTNEWGTTPLHVSSASVSWYTALNTL